MSSAGPFCAESACLVIWGAISTAAGAVHNYAGILAVRLTLGIAEAAFFPVALFTLSKFYTREEMVSSFDMRIQEHCL